MTRPTLLQQIALVLPLSLLVLTAGTLVVIACNPDIDKPTPETVILPCAAPKSLIVWLEYEKTAHEQAAYDFRKPYREPPSRPVFFYARSAAPENLIAERPRAGTLKWGPMALDTPYEVTWRGAGEIHLRVPADATEPQIAEWTKEVQWCEPGALVRVNPPSTDKSSLPTAPLAER